MARINYGRGDGIRILHGLMVQESPAAARRALEDLNLPTPTPDTSHIPLPVRSIMGMFEKAASIYKISWDNPGRQRDKLGLCLVHLGSAVEGVLF